MKKYIILVLSVLMLLSFGGCKKKPTTDPTPKPTPTPTVTKFVSRLGTKNEIETMMQNFKDKTEWTFFLEGFDEDGSSVYGVWDNPDVYQGNYADYYAHGIYPMIDLTVAYNDDNSIWGAMFYVPYVDIAEVKEENRENLVLAEKMIISALLPQLTEKEIEKLIDKLSLVTVDALEAYAKRQADPSEFTATSQEIFLGSSSEKAEYKMYVEYEGELQTMLVTLLPVSNQ